MDASVSVVHASCVALGEIGLLIRGGPGSGKSDLALRLIDDGATLIADDQVCLRVVDGFIWASAPDRLAGLIEVRGLGPLRLTWRPTVALGLVVDLVPRQDIERVPLPATESIHGLDLPRLKLHAFDLSTPAKLRLAARLLATGQGLTPVTSLIGQSA